jgi:hypothetical protein
MSAGDAGPLLDQSPEAEGDAPWWAPESGQPIGGREAASDAYDHDRGPPDTPPPEANGEDF